MHNHALMHARAHAHIQRGTPLSPNHITGIDAHWSRENCSCQCTYPVPSVSSCTCRRANKLPSTAASSAWPCPLQGSHSHTNACPASDTAARWKAWALPLGAAAAASHASNAATGSGQDREAAAARRPPPPRNFLRWLGGVELAWGWLLPWLLGRDVDHTVTSRSPEAAEAAKLPSGAKVAVRTAVCRSPVRQGHRTGCLRCSRVPVSLL